MFAVFNPQFAYTALRYGTDLFMLLMRLITLRLSTLNRSVPNGYE